MNMSRVDVQHCINAMNNEPPSPDEPFRMRYMAMLVAWLAQRELIRWNRSDDGRAALLQAAKMCLPHMEMGTRNESDFATADRNAAMEALRKAIKESIDAR